MALMKRLAVRLLAAVGRSTSKTRLTRQSGDAPTSVLDALAERNAAAVPFDPPRLSKRRKKPGP